MADMWTCAESATLMPPNVGSWNNVKIQFFEKK